MSLDALFHNAYLYLAFSIQFSPCLPVLTQVPYFANSITNNITCCWVRVSIVLKNLYSFSGVIFKLINIEGEDSEIDLMDT